MVDLLSSLPDPATYSVPFADWVCGAQWRADTTMPGAASS